MRSRIAAAALAALALLAAAPLAGCSGDARQTTVTVQDRSQAQTGTVTPLQRGEIRREALAEARAAIGAWLAGDLGTMDPHFSDQQMSYFTGQAATYKAEGRVRVRAHSAGKMDVIEMSDDGREVQVNYDFTDDSYFTDAAGGNATKPTHTAKRFQIFMVVEGERWVVNRILAGQEELQ